MDAFRVEKVTAAGQAYAAAETNLLLRQVPDALAGYHNAQQLGYDADACAGARWFCHMLLGDYRSAWLESDSIAERGGADSNRFWDGLPLANRRVVVRCLHGLGDTLQYVRYLPLVRRQAARVVLEAQPALKGLLTRAGIADEVVTWTDPAPTWDTQVEIVEFPRVFRTTVETIPHRLPYLKVDKTALALQKGKLHVGLVWASGNYNPARSIPVAEISRLLNTPGCEFFSLQAGEERTSLCANALDVLDLHNPNADVLDTASKLVSLDLLITVDTMMAHLAGALAVRVWTLLPFAADWRWMLDREDSPWYPGMRLFRQSVPGDWPAVMDRVRGELTAAAAAQAA